MWLYTVYHCIWLYICCGAVGAVVGFAKPIAHVIAYVREGSVTTLRVGNIVAGTGAAVGLVWARMELEKA